MTRRTRHDIIEAAGRLFAERGYDGTSMRDIGKELGLLGSSIYSHVSGKQELLVAIVDEGADLFQASADAALRSDGTGLARLEAFVAGHIAVVAGHLEVSRTFLNEARALDPEFRSPILAARDRYEAALRRILEDGIADGSFRPGLDPVIGGIFVLSILNAVDRWYRADGRLDRDGLVSAIVQFVGYGVAAP
jgi:AcrR family transcriptional regulator